MGWGLLRDCVSASPALVLFLFSAVFVVWLDFTFQRKLPYIAVDLVYSLEEMSSGFPYSSVLPS